jgi:GxxExxY protein
MSIFLMLTSPSESLPLFTRSIGSWDTGFRKPFIDERWRSCFDSIGLDVTEERMISVMFRGSIIGIFYADMVVAGVILVEIKASGTIEKYAEAQILNYLKAAGRGIGLLLNFGREPSYKRFAMGDDPINSLPSLRSHQG